MNLSALLMGFVLALASFLTFFVGSAFVANQFSHAFASWFGWREAVSSTQVVAWSVLYTLALVASEVYTDRQEKHFHPRKEISWDTYLFILVLFPFLLFFFALHIPRSLLLVVLLMLLTGSFYRAVKRRDLVQQEKRMLEATL